MAVFRSSGSPHNPPALAVGRFREILYRIVGLFHLCKVYIIRT